MAGEAQSAETILSRLILHRDARPDDVFVHFIEESGERPVTYRALVERAGALAKTIAAHVEPREMVFILLPLGPDVLAAFLGAMAARAIPALLAYPSSKVAPDVYAKNLRGVLETTSARHVLTTRSLESALGRALPEGRNLIWVEDATAEPDETPVRRAAAETPPDEVAFLQHSSGSTGLQKGVALSHRSVLNQVRHYSRAIELDPARDVIASWLPLYHDMGLIGTFLMPLVTGTTIVSMDPFRWVTNPAMLLDAMHRHRATLCWLPNFAYVHLARRVSREASAKLDLSRVRGFVNCSEPVRHSSHRLFLERFQENGVTEEKLWTCYAMAENTFAVTHAGGALPRAVDWIDATAFASERVARPAPAGRGIPMVSCGPPIESVKVWIVDEETRAPLDERKVGEIALRSDCMLTEYHKNPTATAAAMDAERNLYTGDLGYLADGHLYITGRKKDLIIVGGRNFYPQDLEDVAGEQEDAIPGRTAAFGVENASIGTEEIVIVAETELDAPERREQLKRRIQRAVLEQLDCAVSRVELVARGWIVKTSSGKVARRANLERWLALRDAEALAAAKHAAPEPAAATGERDDDEVEESLAAIGAKVVIAAMIIALAIVFLPHQALVLYRGF